MSDMISTQLSFPNSRAKFSNYTAVTLGLRGEEGEAVTDRIWCAVDRRLKLETGPGSDCLLTRVKARWVRVVVAVARCRELCRH